MTAHKQLVIIGAIMCLISSGLADFLIPPAGPSSEGRALQSDNSKVCVSSLEFVKADSKTAQGNVFSLATLKLNSESYRVVVLTPGTSTQTCRKDLIYPKQLRFKKSQSRHFADKFGTQILSADGKIYRALTSQYGNVLVAFRRWRRGGKLNPIDFTGDAIFNAEAATKKFGLIKGKADNSKTYPFVVLLD